MSDNKKQNKPNVPNLRFPGFSEEWDRKTFGQCCEGFDYGMNAASKPYDGVNGYIRITDIDEVTLYFKREGIVSPDAEIDENYRVAENDILFARTGASTGKTYLYKPEDGKLYFAGFLIRAKVDSEYDSRFLFYQTQTRRYKKWVQIMSMRSGQPGINSQEFASYLLNNPELSEQKKIASLLELIDQRIVTQSKVIEDLISLEKVFINSSFRDIKGENIPLSVISQRIVDRNANCGCSNVLTISAKDGLVSQLNYFKKSVASQNLSNYYLLQKGDFAYNKSYSTDYPWGAVKHLENYNQGILSPLYFCFRANSRVVNIDYLQLFFDTDIWYKHISEIAVEGARNHGLLNMSVSDFMAMPIPLPSLVEQNKIVYNLMCFRKKRISEIHYLMALEKQKKFLLSQMLI